MFYLPLKNVVFRIGMAQNYSKKRLLDTVPEGDKANKQKTIPEVKTELEYIR